MEEKSKLFRYVSHNHYIVPLNMGTSEKRHGKRDKRHYNYTQNINDRRSQQKKSWSTYMLLFLAGIPTIEWFLVSQLLISQLLPEDINWEDMNISRRLKDVIHEKATDIHNQCFCLNNGWIVIKDHHNKHYNNRYGVLHSCNTLSSGLVLLLNIKRGEEKEII